MGSVLPLKMKPYVILNMSISEKKLDTFSHNEQVKLTSTESARSLAIYINGDMCMSEEAKAEVGMS